MTIKDIILDTEPIEPETIRTLIPGLSEIDYNKIFAVRTLLYTRFFYEDMYIFEDIVLSLNNQLPDFTYLQGCSPQQIWYAVSIASKLRPKIEYSWEVQMYARWLSNEGGVFIYPPEFHDLDNPYYWKAVELANIGQIDNDSPESVQAAKYLIIQEYINQMNTNNSLKWY